MAIYKMGFIIAADSAEEAEDIFINQMLDRIPTNQLFVVDTSDKESDARVNEAVEALEGIERSLEESEEEDYKDYSLYEEYQSGLQTGFAIGMDKDELFRVHTLIESRRNNPLTTP